MATKAFHPVFVSTVTSSNQTDQYTRGRTRTKKNYGWRSRQRQTSSGMKSWRAQKYSASLSTNSWQGCTVCFVIWRLFNSLGTQETRKQKQQGNRCRPQTYGHLLQTTPRVPEPYVFDVSGSSGLYRPCATADDKKDSVEKPSETDDRFKDAPRESYLKGQQIRSQPFGKEVRSIRCVKCKQWGHAMGERECPMKGIDKMYSGEDPAKLEDPLEVMKRMEEGGLRLKTFDRVVDKSAANQVRNKLEDSNLLFISFQSNLSLTMMQQRSRMTT